MAFVHLSPTQYRSLFSRCSLQGIVQASARMCFNHEVQISLLHGRDTDNWDHEVFLVEYPHQISIARALNPVRARPTQTQSLLKQWWPQTPPFSNTLSRSPGAALRGAAHPSPQSEDHKFTLSPLEFTSLFPFHILMDTDCRAVQVQQLTAEPDE